MCIRDRGKDGPKHMDITLTRSKFEELTSDLIDQTAGPVHQALSDAGISTSELHMVLLVGGSTRMPAVSEKVRQLTGKEPSKNMNPDECVALGAAIQGGTIAGEAGLTEILLMAVSYTHLGGSSTSYRLYAKWRRKSRT